VDAASVASKWRGDIRAEGADEAMPIDADARAVRQILDNLIVNATKFSPEGGAIVVRLARGPRAIAIDVIDNGPGLSDADKARLAQPFERGAGVGAVEGAGLGLTLVKALAHAHGGRLEIRDAPGGGALMRVLLPAPRA
jgi:signal transduction histidine kinase